MSLGDVIALAIYTLLGFGIARVFSAQAKQIDTLQDRLRSLEGRVREVERGADRDAR